MGNRTKLAESAYRQALPDPLRQREGSSVAHRDGALEEAMELILSSEEGKFLMEVLEDRHRELLRELAHTDHRDYKLLLKNNAKFLESILDKLRIVEPVLPGE
jgi:hypothetical protein